MHISRPILFQNIFITFNSYFLNREDLSIKYLDSTLSYIQIQHTTESGLFTRWCVEDGSLAVESLEEAEKAVSPGPQIFFGILETPMNDIKNYFSYKIVK